MSEIGPAAGWIGGDKMDVMRRNKEVMLVLTQVDVVLRKIRCGAGEGRGAPFGGGGLPCHALPCLMPCHKYDQRQAVGSWTALATPPRGASEIRARDGASVLPGVRGRIRPCG